MWNAWHSISLLQGQDTPEHTPLRSAEHPHSRQAWCSPKAAQYLLEKRDTAQVRSFTAVIVWLWTLRVFIFLILFVCSSLFFFLRLHKYIDICTSVWVKYCDVWECPKTRQCDVILMLWCSGARSDCGPAQLWFIFNCRNIIISVSVGYTCIHTFQLIHTII